MLEKRGIAAGAHRTNIWAQKKTPLKMTDGLRAAGAEAALVAPYITADQHQQRFQVLKREQRGDVALSRIKADGISLMSWCGCPSGGRGADLRSDATEQPVVGAGISLERTFPKRLGNGLSSPRCRLIS